MRFRLVIIIIIYYFLSSLMVDSFNNSRQVCSLKTGKIKVCANILQTNMKTRYWISRTGKKILQKVEDDNMRKRKIGESRDSNGCNLVG